MLRKRAFISLLAGFASAACPQRIVVQTPDAGTVQADGGTADGGTVDGGTADAGSLDGGIGPLSPCRTMVLPCLDTTDPNVLEVPTQMDAQTAFSTAKANQTIQINGASLGSGWWIPSYVTLHGCNGAQIAGSIGFTGNGGVIEGFQISGSVVANQTGTYDIRYNYFVGGTTDPGASARSIDALVYAQVTAIIESNWFQDRRIGVWLATDYDTGTHEVTATVQNNIFVNCTQACLAVDENGLVGKITATIENNTFFNFADGADLNNPHTSPTLSGCLFVNGTHAVASNNAFSVQYSMYAEISGSPPYTGTILGGSFASASDPGFSDPDGGDFRLQLGSPAADKIPANVPMPATDYYSCPRPALGGGQMADIGAIETQQ